MSFDAIRTRIAAAERAAGRAPGSVTLIAVSKVQPEDRVRAVLETGWRVFGENRVQEAESRWGAFRPAYPDVELHLIGPLQSNKTAPAVGFFDAIHTLDRDKIARRIADAIQAQGRAPHLFVQINTGDESQKAGVSASEADSFIAACRKDYDLALAGLMCIPPVDQDPEPHFRLLAEIAARNGLTGLSMGMSADFETAIRCGATHVRVGSAIFGARAA